LCMPDMVPTLLVATVVPRTGKFIKNCIFKRGEKFTTKWYINLCLGSANCQKSRWRVRIYVDGKPTFLKEP